MITFEEVTGNLFGFYHDICNFSGFSRGELEGISWVRSEKGGWPDFILGGGPVSDESFGKIEEAIITGLIPSNWIREGKRSDFEEKAWDHGIRRINYWRGMTLEPDDKTPRKIYLCDGEVSRIHSVPDLSEWLEVVNSAIISGKKIVPGTFRNILDNKNFDFWQVRLSKRIVSTLLAYYRDTILGIYMVSTSSRHRNKGYASCIVSTAIEYYFGKGIKKFVLHSTSPGYSLYKKLGFKEVGVYSIYQKVGNI